MPKISVSEAVLLETAKAYLATGSITAASRVLGIARSTFRDRLDSAIMAGLIRDDNGFPPRGETPKLYEAEHIEIVREIPDEIDVDELVERRKSQFEKKAKFEEAIKLIDVKVKLTGPIGILHYGDPHVDDDGTDIEALERHARLVNETEGMLAANVGDTTNNWTGRLARLYSEQSTSAAESWALAEWFVKLTKKWLYIVGGNHDLWSGAGDPMKWITRQSGQAYYPSQTRLNLMFPNGREVRINARHDFEGHSQYNPAHGVMKASLMGFKDHIMIAGHKHVSGYGVLKDADSGTISHAIRVASYKKYDRYAHEKGLRDQHISPCAVTIIDPDASEASLVQVFWEPEMAVEYLRFLRSRK